MALSANTVWEVRTDGDDTNGGGFVTGASGTDHSQQAAAQYSVTDAVTNGTTTITSATANFGTDVVGNILYIQGGTGAITAGWYQIISRTNSTTIVVDRSTGLTTGTGATLNIGGALLTIAQALTNTVDGNVVWVRAGSGYTITSGLSLAGAATGDLHKAVRGYGTARGDGTKPTITTSSAITMWTNTGSGYYTLADFLFDGTDVATNGIVASGSRHAYFINVEVTRTKGSGFAVGGGAAFGCRVYDLQATATSGFSTDGGACYYCIAQDLSCEGFCVSSGEGNSGGQFVGCIADTCSIGFLMVTSLATSSVVNCVAYGCTSDGLRNNGTHAGMIVRNFIAVSNGGYGINAPANLGKTGFESIFVDYYASYNNTSGARNNALAGDSDVTLTGDPFTNAASGDFSLNTTAGAGAACRAAGFPGVFPGGLTTGYLDIGAVQHQDSGGSTVCIPTTNVQIVGAKAAVVSY